MKQNHKSIINREDIVHLVNVFYQKIRQDNLLGPVFNKAIPEDQWPAHLDKLTDFWETNLFGVRSFKGNPKLVHQKVDNENDRSISQLHFNRWLNIWIETVDSLYNCDKSDRAKNSARKMSTGLFKAILQGRSNV